MHYPLASPIHGGGGPRKRWKGLASGDNASYSFLHHSGGTPLWWLAPPPLPRWEACHWIFGSLRSPINPVPLPPRFTGALWTLDIAVNLRVEQQRRETHTTGLHPWEMPPQAAPSRRLLVFITV